MAGKIKRTRPPRTLVELEHRERRWQFSLGKLIIASNVLGVIVAVVIATQGRALAWALGIGFLVGFLMPILGLTYIACASVIERLRPKQNLTKFSNHKAPLDLLE